MTELYPDETVLTAGMTPRKVWGIPVREPTPSEVEWFENNPKTAGMAAEDDKIILNPFTTLGKNELESVARNEASRVHMRRGGLRPTFDLTDAQKAAFSEYGDIQDQRETVAARLASGDPSALNATPEQRDFVRKLMERIREQ